MRATVWLAALSLATVLVAGCSDESPNRTNEGWLILSPSGEPVTLELSLDELEYVEINGTLLPGQGGILSGYVNDWGKNCLFGLTVPPEATDPFWEPIEFSIRVPTQAEYQAHSELANLLLVRLDPDGTHFLAPLTLTTTWMPWEGQPPTDLEFWNGSDWGVPTITPNAKRWRVTFSIDHFSDWRVGPRPAPHHGEADEVPAITW